MVRESQLAAFGGESINRRLVVGSEDLESRLGIALALEVELPPNPSSLRIGFIAADQVLVPRLGQRVQLLIQPDEMDKVL